MYIKDPIHLKKLITKEKGSLICGGLCTIIVQLLLRKIKINKKLYKKSGFKLPKLQRLSTEMELYPVSISFPYRVRNRLQWAEIWHRESYQNQKPTYLISKNPSKMIIFLSNCLPMMNRGKIRLFFGKV